MTSMSLISRGFRLCSIALLLTLQCNSFQASSDSSVRLNRVALHARQSTTATDDFALVSPSSVVAGSLTSSGIARRIRQSRSTRGRVTVNVKEENGKKDKDETHLSPKRKVRARKASATRVKQTNLPYESAIEALRAYHAIHGDLVIPRRFVVPEIEGALIG